MTAVVAADRLGKRYRWRWGLRDCTLEIPAGRVVALVGPNGAGKSTLLHLAVGLTDSSAGRIAVLGDVQPGSDQALERIGFVAQDTPLYANLSVRDTLRLVANLSRRWAEADAVAAGLQVVRDQRAARAATLLARVDERAVPPGWQSAAASLEEIVLGYLRTPAATSLPGPLHGGSSLMERSA